jgi:hypothetical protein
MTHDTILVINFVGGVAATIIGMTLGWATATADARAPKPMPLIRAWAQANEACRGTVGTDVRFDHNCWLRGRIDRKLEAQGWVYGWPDVVGACQEWHRPGERPENPDCYFH